MSNPKTQNKAISKPAEQKAEPKAPEQKAEPKLVDPADIIILTDAEIKAETKRDGTRPYNADGEHWIRAAKASKPQTLTREQRIALARRGINLPGGN